MAQLIAPTKAETEDCLLDMVSTAVMSLTSSRESVAILWRIRPHLTCDVQVVAGTVSAKTYRLEGILDFHFTEQQVTGTCIFNKTPAKYLNFQQQQKM